MAIFHCYVSSPEDSPNNPSYKYTPPFSHYITIFIDETWSAFSLKLPGVIMFANHHL